MDHHFPGLSVWLPPCTRHREVEAGPDTFVPSSCRWGLGYKPLSTTVVRPARVHGGPRSFRGQYRPTVVWAEARAQSPHSVVASCHYCTMRYLIGNYRFAMPRWRLHSPSPSPALLDLTPLRQLPCPNTHHDHAPTHPLQKSPILVSVFSTENWDIA